eukprot:634666-Rhodomonas_salina.4
MSGIGPHARYAMCGCEIGCAATICCNKIGYAATYIGCAATELCDAATLPLRDGRYCDRLCCYTSTARWPALSWAMLVPFHYAMAGTEIGYAGTRGLRRGRCLPHAHHRAGDPYAIPIPHIALLHTLSPYGDPYAIPIPHIAVLHTLSPYGAPYAIPVPRSIRYPHTPHRSAPDASPIPNTALILDLHTTSAHMHSTFQWLRAGRDLGHARRDLTCAR